MAALVIQPIANAVAILALGQPEKFEGGSRLDALGRVRSAERGLEQLVRHLKRVQFLARNFQDDRVAHAIGDRAHIGRRILDGRLEIIRHAA